MRTPGLLPLYASGLLLGVLGGACTGSGDQAHERNRVRIFADSIQGAECPTASCAAELDDEEEFLTIVTN